MNYEIENYHRLIRIEKILKGFEDVMNRSMEDLDLETLTSVRNQLSRKIAVFKKPQVSAAQSQGVRVRQDFKRRKEDRKYILDNSVGMKFQK